VLDLCYRQAVRPLLVLLLAAGCATSVPPGGDDAAVDAAAADTPDLDADPDASIDAAAIDAAAIDAAAIDAAAVDAPAVDAPAVDAPVDAPPPPVVALVLTEIVLAPTTDEMIEILNPNPVAVDLSPYYLSDVPTYFRLPAGTATIDTADFIVRFPAGATLAAGGVAVVALDTAANFTATYGVAPTYSVADGTMVTVASSGTPTLTNGGEPVVLLYWDGGSDRVVDVDIMVAGAPSAANLLLDKSGLQVDGPDPDGVGTAYAVDSNSITAQPSTPGSARSTKRIALETAATENQTGGGNGVLGHDETSENTLVTWDSTGFTAPTPGTVPPALTP